MLFPVFYAFHTYILQFCNISLLEVFWSTRTRGYTRTRPISVGMSRVRVDVLRVGSGTGTKSTGTGIPVFNRKEHHFFTMLELYRMFLPERDYVTFGCLLSQFRLSSVCMSVVCRLSVCLSVTLVHPTQGVEPFGKISSPLCTLAIL